MTPPVYYTGRARRDLKRLDSLTARRVVGAIERYFGEGVGEARRLKGSERQYRLRIGDWRVVFSREVRGDVTILAVSHRHRAYR
ncbi:MAG: type II toxin-antitoxin system RelE/ParE family toxin [Acidobacteria bacterium]|nr:type II toxin-antitoxin system RelE/ParE family toxin [Acidobacteriota bacterium]MYA45407.1 type II toxin-antitoxin system RelE/ParE family toxin [Acidobacteriota bacterium]MYI40329.1 type II toxin-antitoxin system RelE/ParE family toxin [Acidobacteriota bacterium]